MKVGSPPQRPLPEYSEGEHLPSRGELTLAEARVSGWARPGLCSLMRSACKLHLQLLPQGTMCLLPLLLFFSSLPPSLFPMLKI